MTATDNRNQSGGQSGSSDSNNNSNSNSQSGNSSDTNRDNNRDGQSGDSQGQDGQGYANNGQNGDGIGNTNDMNVEGWTPGQVGAVKDPENDGRLKENRAEGKTLGTTEHSAQAPYAQNEGSGRKFEQGQNDRDNGSDSGNQGGGNSNS